MNSPKLKSNADVKFTKAYFDAYGGKEGSYDQNPEPYAPSMKSLKDLCEQEGVPVRSILDLGAATGQMLKREARTFGARRWKGVEISDWAVSNAVIDNVLQGDVLSYLDQAEDQPFDLLMLNLLMYFNEAEIGLVLAKSKRLLARGGLISTIMPLDGVDLIPRFDFRNGCYLAPDDGSVIVRPKRW